MKLRFMNSKNHFGSRLVYLYNQKGIDISETHAAKQVAIEMCKYGYVDTTDNYKDDPALQNVKHKYVADTIRKHLDIEKANDISTKWLITYHKYFGCSYDYLMGLINRSNHENTDIASLTGLSEKSIKYLHAMMQTDSAPGNLNNQSINTLNNLLCSKHFAQFLEQFKDYLNCDYSVPVYRTSPDTPDMEAQSADYNPNAGLYMMHLAKSAANPTDYKTFAITPNFMEAITKNEINETLSQLKNDITKKRPSRE